MRISIAMATYNGDLYLQQQLDSFVNQTRKPDELIVCDDGSNDDTLKILAEFKNNAPFPVFIYFNKKQMGYSGNFNKALSLCTGDLIFLSDQDDVWFSNKIEKIALLFSENLSKLLIINDCEITNELLHRSGLTQIGQLVSAGLNTESFVNGCCTAISSELLSIILPIPQEELAHDNWIHKITIALDERIIINEVLQFYRRHSNHSSKTILSQNKPASRFKLARNYIADNAEVASIRRVATLDRMINRLLTASSNVSRKITNKKIVLAINNLSQEKEAVTDRQLIQRQTRFKRIYMAIKFYNSDRYKYFSGWKSLVRDLLK